MKDELTLAKEWMDEAKKCKPDDLKPFFDKLMNHEHDYGTVCRAIAAIGVAAMTAANKHENGGITGFQAGCVTWDVISGWGTFSEGPKRMMQYDHMLYPQYADHFSKTISSKTWKYLQEEAKKKLDESGGVPQVREHWQSIVDGQVPFGYEVRDD